MTTNLFQFTKPDVNIGSIGLVNHNIISLNAATITVIAKDGTILKRMLMRFGHNRI